MNRQGVIGQSIFAMLALIAVLPAQAGSPIDTGGFQPPTPFAIPLSATGPDQLQSVAPGPGGSFYAAGFVATTVVGPRQVVVVKITSAGSLDTGFGLQGVAHTGLIFTGGSDEIDIVAQNGQPVVSATIANSINPLDRDVALVRLTTTGAPDTAFGISGTRILDLNTAFDAGGGTLVGRDGARALALGVDGSIYLHAIQRGEGNNSGGDPRTDVDFAVVKLTADGDVNGSWGNVGKFTLDLQESNETPRAMVALADGTVIGMGYANTPGLGSTQPVVYKLTSTGDLDTNFATGGVFHDLVLAIQSEIYGGVVHGVDLVTAGYGREIGQTNDYLSMRFSTVTGDRDPDWGGAPNGAVLVDPSGVMLGSNCRNAVALPDGRTALLGSTGPGNQPSQDAALVILTAEGTLDTGFGSGIMTFVFGSNGNDQFWGGAVNEGQALFVGYKGGGANQTDLLNDDAYALILPLTDDVIFRNDFESP